MRHFAICTVFIALAGWAQADSLFNQTLAKQGALVTEKLTRFKAGDIITVMVKEEIDASTIARTDTKKDVGVESKAPAASNTFFTTPSEQGGLNIINAGELPNIKVDTKNETKNTGTTTRKTTLETAVTCFVKEVYTNGNLLLEGTKQMNVNREDSSLLVSGVVRSRDVTAANTVESTKLANAIVQLHGKGPLWNNQRRGLLTRIMDWISPY